MGGDFPTLTWRRQTGRPPNTLLQVELAAAVDQDRANAVVDTVKGFCVLAELGAFVDPAGG